MSGHRASRRRDYGRRQKDIKGRHAESLDVVLDTPEHWARGGAWDTTHASGGAARAASRVPGSTAR